MTKNKKNQDKRKTIYSTISIFSPLSQVEINKFLKESLIYGVVIFTFLILYLVHGPAFAQYYDQTPTFTQTESNSSLVIGKAVSSDGSVHVTIMSTPIEPDQPLALQISFADPQGKLIPYENYGIRAQQMEGNGVLILSNESALASNGKDIQVTGALQNVSPVNFQIQLQGSGAPNTSMSEWKGPNEIVSITIGGQYSAHTAVSQAPAGTSQVVTIPYGAYNPQFNTDAPSWYAPSTVTISVNQSVTWINQDKETHTVTSGHSSGRASLLGNSVGQPNGLFDSGNILIDKSWTHKFTTTGTFEYYCTLHPWMQGYVIVKPSESVPVDAYGNDITKFPVIRLTPDRAYEVDLDWEPHYITTGKQITFIYQVYDNIKYEAIPAHYIFTITQNGQQLYKVEDSTQFGGAYQYFRFDNTGPVTFEFSDIAHTDQAVQYTTVVNPGNSTDTSDMNMPMVEPARNMDVNFWLMPLFFVPAGGAVAVVYVKKRTGNKTKTRLRPSDMPSDKTSAKKMPI
ncbi:MAG TPA: plastocyanin/azurin family copper-binding protein [Candidatus Nitrosotalea sp.]|nr:plastocyanin/azurin family copper-binding protein [Candidatus Nitrosotalea sp.]